MANIPVLYSGDGSSNLPGGFFKGIIMTDEQVDKFIDICDEKIQEWHESDSDLELHEYLGLTVNEYARFVENPRLFVRGIR